MRRMRTGRDAAPEGSVSSTGPPGVSGDTARPNYMGPSGNGLVGADERRAKNSAGSRAFRMGAPVRFQKAVSRSKENAAVERREATPYVTGRTPQGVSMLPRACRRSAPSHLVRGDVSLAASEGKTMTAHPAPRLPGAA